jgi:hypothetical protein
VSASEAGARPVQPNAAPCSHGLAPVSTARWADNFGNVNIVHVDWVNEADRGRQLALLTLLLGGLPSALIAIACSGSRATAAGTWEPRWQGVFLAGLIFQAGHIVLAAPWVLLLLVDPFERPAKTAYLLVSVVASIIALPRWRRLQLAACSVHTVDRG